MVEQLFCGKCNLGDMITDMGHGCDLIGHVDMIIF